MIVGVSQSILKILYIGGSELRKRSKLTPQRLDPIKIN